MSSSNAANAEDSAVTSEQLLAEFARSRSEAAFHELVRRHLPLVYHAALRVTNGDQHLAEDVAQVVFTDFATKAARLSSGSIVAGWLHQHTWFTASKMVRTERRRALREQQSMQSPDSSSDELDSQLRPVLDQALTELKAEDRDALVLRFFESADLRRVGATFGISEDAAQKRIARALEKLRGVLAARGVTISSAALTAFLAAQSNAAPISISVAQIASTAALAGAASAPWIATVLSSTKAKLSLAAALTAAVGTPILWQQNTISKLRSENAAFRDSLGRLEMLKSENDELRKGFLSPAEAERLKKDLSELMRLRGEVTLLRQQPKTASATSAKEEKEDSADKEQKQPAQVTISAQVAELSHERMAMLLQQGFPAVADPKNFILTLNAEQAAEVFRLFEQMEGIDLLSAPRLTTLHGREARIAVTDDLVLPNGETLPLGLTVGVFPEVQPDETSIKLAADVNVTEFLGWENVEQTVPRTRTRSVKHATVLGYGEVLLMAGSVRKQEGEQAEPKLQIYCLRSTVIDAAGNAIAPRTQATAREEIRAGAQ
jgi:RNA polymerase sigma factor (sigma-70 family)